MSEGDTNASLVLIFKDYDQMEYASDLFHLCAGWDELEYYTSGFDFPVHLQKREDDFNSWDIDRDQELDGKPVIQFESSHANVDGMADYIQHLMRKFDWQPFHFMWTYYEYRKLKPDSHGGGVVVITKTNIQRLDLLQWVQERIKELDHG